jgi:hypothetical protein
MNETQAALRHSEYVGLLAEMDDALSDLSRAPGDGARFLKLLDAWALFGRHLMNDAAPAIAELVDREPPCRDIREFRRPGWYDREIQRIGPRLEEVRKILSAVVGRLFTEDRNDAGRTQAQPGPTQAK